MCSICLYTAHTFYATMLCCLDDIEPPFRTSYNMSLWGSRDVLGHQPLSEMVAPECCAILVGNFLAPVLLSVTTSQYIYLLWATLIIPFTTQTPKPDLI